MRDREETKKGEISDPALGAVTSELIWGPASKQAPEKEMMLSPIINRRN